LGGRGGTGTKVREEKSLSQKKEKKITWSQTASIFNAERQGREKTLDVTVQEGGLKIREK